VARGIRPKRYAQAVFEIALERNELDQWQSELAKLVRLVEDAALVTALASPQFPFKEKAKLLTEAAGKLNPRVLNLAFLLIARGRLDIIGQIAAEYQKLVDSHRGIERAEVTTAIPLDKEDKLKLTKHLEAVVGRKVLIEPEVDSGVVGGFVARIGDKLLDGSTRSKLTALKRELSGTRR
jgi:F-type H+-transporting ATPase subunit delta